MSAGPYLDNVRLLESLKGEPRVSYPEGSLSFPVTERVVVAPRVKATLNFYTPEPDTVRFADLVLTGQEEVAGDRHNANMYRRYERLPGKATISLLEHDGLARVDIFRAEWNERRSVPPPAVGGRVSLDTGSGIIANAVVLDHGDQPLDGARHRVWITACVLPTVRFERVSLGYTFPAVFQDYNSWWSLDTDFRQAPPWLGVHFSYLAPRTLTVTGRRELVWTVGAPASVPQVYNVFTNASLSRIFPQISNKTVHGAFTRIETTPSFAQAVVESFPASEPATYSPEEILIVGVQSRVWRGPIFVTEITKVREARSL